MQYISVDIKKFRSSLKDLPFDVYIKLSENHYSHLFSKTSGLDFRRLEKYISRGVNELFIKKSDQPNLQKYLENSIHLFSNLENLNLEKKVTLLLTKTEQNLAQIFSELNLSNETILETEAIIKNYSKISTQNPETLALFLKLISFGDYLYYHSVCVSVFSILIAKYLKIQPDIREKIIGLGGFFHDIGRSQISQEINFSKDKLDSDQWKKMKDHPKIGLKMLQDASYLPDEVRYIIYQHHERPDGNGYPNRLKNDEIYEYAKLISVCDSFSALLSERPFRTGYSAEAAIALMKSEIGKFDPQYLTALEEFFIHSASIRSAA